MGVSKIHLFVSTCPWTATPALIKVKETGQINKHFYMQEIFITAAICGNTYSAWEQYHIYSPKGSFSPLLNPITTQIHPRYTLFSAQGVQLSGKAPFVKF